MQIFIVGPSARKQGPGDGIQARGSSLLTKQRHTSYSSSETEIVPQLILHLLTLAILYNPPSKGPCLRGIMDPDPTAHITSAIQIVTLSGLLIGRLKLEQYLQPC